LGQATAPRTRLDTCLEKGGQIPSGLNPNNPKKEVIMTTQDKFVKRKLSILELAEFLKNVSQACKINGVSRQHLYDVRKAFMRSMELKG
jgi:hypothetical protein